MNWGAAVPLAADMAFRIATLGLSDKLNLAEVVGKLTGEDAEKAMRLVEREQATRYREQVTSLEQFHRQLKGLVERYRAAGFDLPDTLLRYYRVHRALVRAKVACIRAQEVSGEDPELERVRGEAAELMRLGHRFAWRSRGPRR